MSRTSWRRGRALTEDGHTRAKYVLTGPEAITQVEQARLIGKAIGRSVRFEEIAPDVARRELFVGLPPQVVDNIIAGHAAMVSNPEPVTFPVIE